MSHVMSHHTHLLELEVIFNALNQIVSRILHNRKILSKTSSKPRGIAYSSETTVITDMITFYTRNARFSISIPRNCPYTTKYADKTIYTKNCVLKIVYYSINGLVSTTDAKPLIQSSNFHKRGNLFARNKSGDILQSKTRNINLPNV